MYLSLIWFGILSNLVSCRIRCKFSFTLFWMWRNLLFFSVKLCVNYNVKLAYAVLYQARVEYWIPIQMCTIEIRHIIMFYFRSECHIATGFLKVVSIWFQWLKDRPLAWPPTITWPIGIAFMFSSEGTSATVSLIWIDCK